MGCTMPQSFALRVAGLRMIGRKGNTPRNFYESTKLAKLRARIMHKLRKNLSDSAYKLCKLDRRKQMAFEKMIIMPGEPS